jgi:hypothetical protein
LSSTAEFAANAKLAAPNVYPSLGEMRTDDPQRDVDRPAGGKRHHDLDRPAGVALLG